MGVGKGESWVKFAAPQLNSLSAPLLPPIREAISLVCWRNGGLLREGKGGGEGVREGGGISNFGGLDQ